MRHVQNSLSLIPCSIPRRPDMATVGILLLDDGAIAIRRGRRLGRCRRRDRRRWLKIADCVRVRVGHDCWSMAKAGAIHT